MSMLNYIKSLVTVIKKPSVLEDARITLTELKIKTIPAYQDATVHFREKGFETDEINDFAKLFSRIVGGSVKQMPLEITNRLKSLEKVVEQFSNVVEKSFEETTIADGLSILKLNAIKVMDSAAFISRYALHFLNYVYTVETAAKMKDENYVKDHISPGQTKWINDNFLNFCQLLSALGISEEKAKKLIEDAPDVILGINPEEITATLGESVVNPLGIMGFSPSSSNPIYHIRLMIAQYQANRYKEAVDLKTVLELRLLNLKRKNDGTYDAKLEKEIEYTQSRVDSLSEKIRSVEESVE